MKKTIDTAGRAGEAESTVDGTGIRIEPAAGHGLAVIDGRLIIPASGADIDDKLVRVLRAAGRR